MTFAEGGYIPGDAESSDPWLKLWPGERLYSRDGRIWQVSDDGEQIELIVSPQEES